MQSKENQQNKQEETPGEEVTISMEEYSEMKKRLQEQEGMDSRMQSRKGKESSGVVPETSHKCKGKQLNTKNYLSQQTFFLMRY